MALINVNEVMQRIAAMVDQTITTPTQGGSEWNLRLKYINMALDEWVEAYDWEALRSVIWPTINGVSQASVSLPADFSKTANFPRYYSGGVSGGEEWAEIKPHEAGLQATSDKYFYILGNRADGYTMVWNPGTIASGASLRIDYFSVPTALASPADVPPMEDPQFLVERTTAYILESRSDGRFQEMETKARETLLNMIDNENAKGFSHRNRVMTPEKLYYGFRVGRDG